MGLGSAIDIRRSQRHYDGQSIDKERKGRLIRALERYNEEAGLAFTWVEKGGPLVNGYFKSYGMFSGVPHAIACLGRREDADMAEKIGYYGELLVLEATLMGLGTCWVGGTYDKNSNIFRVPEGYAITNIITVGEGASELSRRERLLKKAVGGRKKAPCDLYTAKGSPPGLFLRAMDAVAKAPSAMNRQSVRIHYDEGLVTATCPSDKTGDLLDLGIAKCHFTLVVGGSFAWGNGGQFDQRM